MNTKLLSLTCAVGAGVVMATNAMAQSAQKLEFPQPSPASTLKQKVGLTDVEFNYSRPSAKGREIWGNVVPYGQVWRTGANAATKLVFSTKVKLNGKEIPAGTYVLLTVPNKDEWSVMINKNVEQTGPYKYDAAGNVAEFKAKPVKLAQSVETFTIDMQNLRESAGDLTISWGNLAVPLKLEVDFIDQLYADIEKTMAGDGKDKPYFWAAAFYNAHDHELEKAKKWIDQAIAEKEAFYIVHQKAQILKKLGDKAGAKAAAERSLELSKQANDYAYIKLNNDFLAGLK